MTEQVELKSDSGNTQSSPRSKRSVMWFIVHAAVYLPLRLWCRTHAIGRENLNPDRGGILLVNHQSFFDPLFVTVRLTRAVSFLARDTLFKIPFLSFILRTTFVIPISRTAFRGGSIRTAIDRLNAGYLVGIFPEGTRSAGAPERFRPGFLSLARRTDLPIYPVAIVGADRVLPKGSWFARPGRVTVIYGEQLTPKEREQVLEGKDDRAIAAMMHEKVSALYWSVAGAVTQDQTPPESTTEAQEQTGG